MLRRAVVVWAICISSAPALAGTGWVDVEIKSLFAWVQSGGQYIMEIDQTLNPENCTYTDDGVPAGSIDRLLRWNTTYPNAEGMYSTALSAYVPGAPVQVYVYSRDSETNYPLLWGVRIAK